MNIEDIVSKSSKPPLYEKGTAFMWTNDHISKQLLKIHLDPQINLASRKLSSIQSTSDWILGLQKEKRQLEILDLGCGPGLYSEIFASQGHYVTGLDISQNSIEHAKRQAAMNKQQITYIQANYLDYELPAQKFDLVTLIYTDLGVLTPSERNKLISNISQSLKKGGMFIFDVLKDNDLESKATARSWEVSRAGFWHDAPHIVLSDSFFYREEKVILYQHLVIDEEDHLDVYRFWTHFFSSEDLQQIMTGHGFSQIDIYDNILPAEDIWTGSNVLFCSVIKG
jgi:2-polyprenyl-3-methyl-5-hydroxy-6-metoxy-1,4-benzoquinol methylase